MQSYPQPTPLTLMLDCAQTTQKLALWQGKVLDVHNDADKRASSRLHVALTEMLTRQGLTLADVGRLVLTLGAGSFTGIRVGIAFAQALKLATGVEIRTLTSFDAISYSAKLEAPHTVILDSLGQEIFLQHYSTAGAPTGAPLCVPKVSFVAPELLMTNDAFNFPPAQATPLDINAICAQATTLSTDLTPLYVKGLNFRKIGA